jgi:hypothetical protein
MLSAGCPGGGIETDPLRGRTGGGAAADRTERRRGGGWTHAEALRARETGEPDSWSVVDMGLKEGSPGR